MRYGKRSSGYGPAAKIGIIALCLAVVILAAFATHTVYTEFFAPYQPQGPDAVGPQLSGGGDLPGDHLTGPTQESTAPPSTPATRPISTTQATTLPQATTQEATAPTTAPTTAPEDTTVAATTQPPTTQPPTTQAEETTLDPNIPVPNEHGLYSKAALLLKLSTGEEIYALQPDERIYPASLSKMMTAILTIENNPDLSKKVTITEAMLKGLKEASASTAGFAVGEAVTLEDLLYGVMLPSGADATNAVAFATAGSVAGFVDMMNQKAADIGMSDTSFANTHGLHDPNLYSTCRDMATLLTYCLENNDFRRVFTTGTYITSATPEHPSGISLSNSMTKSLGEHPMENGKILGNKTGFTTPAGQCLASLAKIGGQEYILITVGAGRAGYNQQRYNMLDALELYGRISSLH